MSRTAATFIFLSVATTLSLSACSSGDVASGSSQQGQQALQTNKDGTPTGNGSTCSWDDSVSNDGSTSPPNGGGGSTSPPNGGGGSTSPPNGGGGSASPPNGGGGSASPPNGGHLVGDNFKAPDGCNDCTCTAQGIACTLKDCGGTPGPGPCTDEAKLCPDGSSVTRTGPNCAFAECSKPKPCPADAIQCPDGSTATRTGPKCEFTPCPTPVICPTDAKQCPNGGYVSRTGPNCAFAPCP